MNDDMKDYRSGLKYFIALMVCICLCFTTPDGEPLFYKLLGLFGISPGIQLGANSTLYIYMLIPLIAGVVCIKRVFAHWWGYGKRFAGYSAVLRYIPVIIILLVFAAPSMLDAAYYQAIGSKGGLDAVVLYDPAKSPDPMRYEFTGSTRTYCYDFTLQNLGDSAQTFQVKYIDNWLTRQSPEEILLREGNGDVLAFTLSPGQRQKYTGEFTAVVETDASSGSGTTSIPTFVLLNETERHSPAVIKKPPRNSY